jgi:DNA-binding MarR family transcriptional regulator
MVASTNVAHLQEIIETQRRRINELETELEHKYKTTSLEAKVKSYETILSNKALPIGHRLAQIAVKRLTEKRDPDANGWYRAYLPALAESVGVSPSTMSRSLKNLADCTQVIEHRSISDADEPGKLIVSIRCKF